MRLERLLELFDEEISEFALRDIATCDDTQRLKILHLVASFQELLGPIGAGKALHLLAPSFFPLWDNKIAKDAYGVPVNLLGYLAMMAAVQAQCNSLRNNFGNGEQWENVLKLIDEYNYGFYSRGWLTA